MIFFIILIHMSYIETLASLHSISIHRDMHVQYQERSSISVDLILSPILSTDFLRCIKRLSTCSFVIYNIIHISKVTVVLTQFASLVFTVYNLVYIQSNN